MFRLRPTSFCRRQSAVCHAGSRPPWRPHIDDVDRLSHGDAAKVRGTGSRDIPHRLNAEEREAYLIAKKKGYLAVRGTGYRKERKGNPLPNIFRQWCDAKEVPCIVIEQDMMGGPIDRLVVDFTTLRCLDTTSAQEACLAIASSLGVRPLGPDERAPSDVPFNVLPLMYPWGDLANGGGSGRTTRFIGISGTPSNVIKTHANALQQQQQQRSLGAASSASTTDDVGSSAPTLSKSAAGISAVAVVTLGSTQQQLAGHNGDLLQQAALQLPQRWDSHPGPGLEELQRHAGEMQQLLAHQRDLVRQLKEGGGRGNADPEVQGQVQRLLQLKAVVSLAESAVASAQDNIAVSERQAASSRRAILYEAFSPDAHQRQADDASQQGSSISDDEQSRADGRHQNLEVDPDSDPKPVDLRDGRSKGREADLMLHPFCQAATWQLPADPLFFEADRSTAKQFAREAVQKLAVVNTAKAL